MILSILGMKSEGEEEFRIVFYFSIVDPQMVQLVFLLLILLVQHVLHAAAGDILRHKGAGLSSSRKPQ